MSEEKLLRRFSNQKLKMIISGCRGDGNAETKKIAKEILWQRKIDCCGEAIKKLEKPLAWQI
jgi:hypothetical protein